MPYIWEIKLTSNQLLPAHVFDTQVPQIFIEGPVTVAGAGSCGVDDARWADAGAGSGAWKASSEGACWLVFATREQI
jgi:hypothetical protein